jgi:hypothetical protein
MTGLPAYFTQPPAVSGETGERPAALPEMEAVVANADNRMIARIKDS